MSPACDSGKIAPLALMIGPLGSSPHHRIALIPAPTVWRASEPVRWLTSPLRSPSIAVRLAANKSVSSAMQSRRLRRRIAASNSCWPHAILGRRSHREAAVAKRRSALALDGVAPIWPPRSQRAWLGTSRGPPSSARRDRAVVVCPARTKDRIDDAGELVGERDGGHLEGVFISALRFSVSLAQVLSASLWPAA